MADYVKEMLASGEVLLIETRQHWVALIRYAVKPLLLVGVVILLALFNQWVKFDTLGFINVIINWVLILAIVVSLVWLPIDFVQWWSRRYVLTNRRAIRAYGVLRKQSFDSSLEQINDIRLSQSFFGQKLGYADLTLLTANSSNEAYEQLLDGPQFKMALLGAKDAIRSGAPLTGLADDFVVRGGTNAASIKRYSKAKDEASATTDSAAATGAASAAGATTAAVIEPAPEMAPLEPIVAAPVEPVTVAPLEPVTAPSEPEAVVAAAPVEPPVAEPITVGADEAASVMDEPLDEPAGTMVDDAASVMDEPLDAAEEAVAEPIEAVVDETGPLVEESLDEPVGTMVDDAASVMDEPVEAAEEAVAEPIEAAEEAVAEPIEAAEATADESESLVEAPLVEAPLTDVAADLSEGAVLDDEERGGTPA